MNFWLNRRNVYLFFNSLSIHRSTINYEIVLCFKIDMHDQRNWSRTRCPFTTSYALSGPFAQISNNWVSEQKPWHAYTMRSLFVNYRPEKRRKNITLSPPFGGAENKCSTGQIFLFCCREQMYIGPLLIGWSRNNMFLLTRGLRNTSLGTQLLLTVVTGLRLHQRSKNRWNRWFTIKFT